MKTIIRSLLFVFLSGCQTTADLNSCTVALSELAQACGAIIPLYDACEAELEICRGSKVSLMPD